MQQATDTKSPTEMQDHFSFEVSPFTKIFQSELKKISANHDLESLPTEFVEKYNLQKSDDQYSVKGFIQTNEEWNAQSLTDLGIKTGANTGKMQTVSIPLNRFNEFMGLSGINYFQLNESVNPKK